MDNGVKVPGLVKEIPRPLRASLHHIGLVVDDAALAGEALAALGLGPGNTPEPDPIQKVAASFLDLTGNNEIFLELLEPLGEDSPVSRHLDQGGGLHHLCFRVADIEATYQALIRAGYRPASPPQVCLGMDRSFGRRPQSPSRVAFVLAPLRLLIELVEVGR